METLVRDVRFAVRSLRKSPGFTIVAVLTLALGIGATTAIFSLADGVLFRALPFDAPERLVALFETNRETGSDRVTISLLNFADWRAQSDAFEAMAVYEADRFTLHGAGSAAVIQGAAVSPGFFTVLGVQPVLGRTFRPDEEAPGAGAVVVLSHGLWERRFGADTDVVGRTLIVDDEPVTIVGVLPDDFSGFPGLEGADVWTPLTIDEEEVRRGWHWLGAVARLRPGTGIERAEASLNTIARRLEEAYPESNAGYGVNVVPLRRAVTADIRPALLILLGAVAFVLLIACVNVASLLLVRARTREREVAIRTALGAGRGRLVRQLLTEGLLLALLGGALGVLVAFFGKDLILWLSPRKLPSGLVAEIDVRVLGFAALITVATGLAAGLLPALRGAGASAILSLGGGERSGGADEGGRRIQSSLVVAEVAFALALLVGGGLLINSFWRLMQVDAGFRADHVLTMRVSLPDAGYSESPQQAAFYRKAIRRIEALPAARTVGAVQLVPLRGPWGAGFHLPGASPEAAAEEHIANYRIATPDYFEAMGIPLLRGRLFTDFDHESAPEVVVIDQAMGREYWPGEDPVSKRLSLEGPEGPWAEVVGVVGTVRHGGLAAEGDPTIYVPFAQRTRQSMALVVRTRNDPLSLAPLVRSEIREIDPDVPVFAISSMEQAVSESVAEPRFIMLLVGFFGAVAAMLAGLGIYGVMAYAVAQRTREIGIRSALGADMRDILRLVLARGLKLTALGTVLGLLLAYATTGVLSSVLYGVGATDPATFAAVALVLTGIAMLASYLPARRASRVDPMVAMRAE